MLAKICLYIGISNIWILYRLLFKRKYLNDKSMCSNPFTFILRYLLTISIGIIDFYLLIFISFITGIFIGKSINIGRRTKEIKNIVDKNADMAVQYVSELAILNVEIKNILKIINFNKNIISILSSIRKKLIV